MTAHRSYSLRCDHGECHKADPFNPTVDYTSAAIVREFAAAAGWTRKGPDDLCPQHSAPARPLGGSTPKET